VAATFAPGPFIYFHSNTTSTVGLELPMKLAMGIPVGSAVMLNVGVEAPLYVLFGNGGGLVFPVLVGAGAEYYLDRNLAITFNARMGPSVLASSVSYFDTRFGTLIIRSGGPTAELTLETTLGVAYRL
jgi:hypothetical protein